MSEVITVGAEVEETTGDVPTPNERTRRIYERLAGTDDPTKRAGLLEEVVTVNMGLAHAVARRYRGRGIDADDLTQVAYVGLVKAARGFDPTVGCRFASYAAPTIAGEVKRHFRNHGWVVRPPRRLQEAQHELGRAGAELSQRLGRSPRPREIAEWLSVDVETVIEALAVDACFTPDSLDAPAGSGPGSVGDLVEADDRRLARAEATLALAPAVRKLSPRDQLILERRFFQEWTQGEIAAEIGVTQMQVSRLLSRMLAELRSELD